MRAMHLSRSTVRRRMAIAVTAMTFILCALFTSSGLAAAEPGGTLSRTDSTYISYLQEIFNLSRGFGDSIWPGLDYNRIPVLLYRPDSVAFLFNHPNPPPDFQPAAGLPWSFQNPVYAHQGRVGDLTGQFWTEMDINDHATFVCPYDEDSTWEERFFRFVVHEAFHTFQSMTFRDRGDTDEKRYPITIAENNALATLENLILAKAMDGLIAGHRDEVTRRARQFVIVREERLQKAPAFVRQHEQIEERQENTAFYVEKRCEEAGSTPGYAQMGFRQYTHFDPYHSHAEVLRAVRDGILEHVKDGAIAPVTMPRFRIYDNGAALGYLLDYFNVDWKGQAASDSAFLFHPLLGKAVGLAGETERRDHDLAGIEREFDFAKVLTASAANIDDYNRQTRALEQEIRAAGKIAFRITMTVKGGVSKSSTSSRKVLYTNAGQTSLIEHADRFLVKTGQAAVTVRGRGLIYARGQDGKTITVEVFADQMPSGVTLDGRRLPPDRGDYTADSSFHLELGDALNVVGGSGTLRLSQDTIVVDLQ